MQPLNGDPRQALKEDDQDSASAGRDLQDIWSGTKQRFGLLRRPDWITLPVIISILALFTTLYTNYEARRYSRLAAQPILGVVGNIQTDVVELALENAGSGTALTEWSRISVNGVRVHTWKEAFEQAKLPMADNFIAHEPLPSVGPNGREPILTFKPGPGWDDFKDRLLARLRIEICYCSVYGECWLAEGGHSLGARNLNLEGCPRVEKESTFGISARQRIWGMPDTW